MLGFNFYLRVLVGSGYRVLGGVWFLVARDVIVFIVTFRVGAVARLCSASGRDIGSFCVGTGVVLLRGGWCCVGGVWVEI